MNVSLHSSGHEVPGWCTYREHLTYNELTPLSSNMWNNFKYCSLFNAYVASNRDAYTLLPDTLNILATSVIMVEHKVVELPFLSQTECLS